MFSINAAMTRPVSPLRGKTTDWRAVCGRSARTVRREGGLEPTSSPYPYNGITPVLDHNRRDLCAMAVLCARLVREGAI